MKTLGKIFLKLLGFILLVVLFIDALGTRADIVEGITGDKIKQIKRGMKLDEVVAILGRPYKINSLGGVHTRDCRHNIPILEMDVNNQTDIKAQVEKIYIDTNYCCGGNKDDKQNKFVTLTYTRPVFLSEYYPMLWVHLDSAYKVFNVFAKQYNGIIEFDDDCIYNDGVTDEKKFTACFK